MRLRIILPKVDPKAITTPTRCAYAGCGGRKFHLRQQVAKPLRDTVYQQVQVLAISVYAANARSGSIPRERRVPRVRNA